MEVLFFNLSLILRSSARPYLVRDRKPELPSSLHKLLLADLRSTAALLSSFVFFRLLFDRYVLAGFTVMNAATELLSVTPWTQSVIDTTLRRSKSSKNLQLRPKVRPQQT
jgi:hypothetical protein